MELADIRAFARIAELGSVTAAARSLDLPKSTISRALVRLEIAVGATLVDRSTRHLRLTDAGVLFRPYAARILADIDEAGTALDNFAGVPRGALRISAPFTFVVAILSPMLPSFLARYPEVRVFLNVENRVIDMPLEPADLVIRVAGALADSDLIARHLLTTEAWTCASPGYLEAHGVPSGVAELGRHVLIAYADQPTIWSFQMPGGATQQIEFRPAHAVSDSVAMQPMLIGGSGIGRLPDFIARDAVARGELVQLFRDTEGDKFQVHALSTSHRSLSAKVRVFIDALVAYLAAKHPADR
jgi:DNA-binding transcriptional LysR family regulator